MDANAKAAPAVDTLLEEAAAEVLHGGDAPAAVEVLEEATAKVLQENTSKVLNSGAKRFGLPMLVKYCALVRELEPDVPCVSVGCGTMSVEVLLAKAAGLEFLGVDPDPTSWQRSDPAFPEQKPVAPSVQALLTAQPELRGNCTLFLNWTTPGEPWDMEAGAALLAAVGGVH